MNEDQHVPSFRIRRVESGSDALCFIGCALTVRITRDSVGEESSRCDFGQRVIGVWTLPQTSFRPASRPGRHLPSCFSLQISIKLAFSVSVDELAAGACVGETMMRFFSSLAFVAPPTFDMRG